MKRSEINEIIRDSDAFIRSFGFILPPYAYYGPDALKQHVITDSAMIRDHMLGWDITDFGQGRFDKLGLVLFTIRNGDNANVRRGRGMLYAEKLLISAENQVTPMHRHNLKTEDIINRGGATLALQLNKVAADGSVDDNAPVRVRTDGRWREMAGGDLLRLMPGESVTLETDIWHAFWGEGGRVLIGEVSNVNDDRTDNLFRDPVGRFSEIEEDEAPLHLLVSDYDEHLG